MTQTVRATFVKLHGLGLFQIALVGTAFAALRLLTSPSTLTFFVFESALAATLGIFLSVRLAQRSDQSSSLIEDESNPETDANTSSALPRLRSLAVRLGLTPTGGTEDLRGRIKSELSKGIRAGEVDTSERALAELLVLRIAPRAYNHQVSRTPSATARYLRSLAEEGSTLLSLSQDLELTSTSFKTMLRKACKASANGRADAAVRMTEQGNERLRRLLRGRITDDLTESHTRSRRAYLGLSSLFVFMTAMALLALSEGLYVAPLTFYVLLAMAAGALSLNAHFSGNHRPIGVLLQILILAVLVKFYFFYLNPYLYTSDSFFHFLGLQGILSTGYVPEFLGHYFYFPAYHAFGFTGVNVAGLPLTWFGLFASLAQLAAVPVSYLIGREIASPRVGLFSAILTVFSVFFFLPTIPAPALFGFVFLFTAIYALVKMRGPASRVWLAVFWISALGSLFSHPITALVLILALLLRFMHFHVLVRRAPSMGPSPIPVLSYGVVYTGYLAFFAFVSFELFVTTMFAPTYSPPLATSPTRDLQITGSYLLQSALAPSSIAVLLFFASYGMFSFSGISATERRYLVLLGLIFILIPALEVATENFRGQSSRFLSYMVVPLVLLGAHGVVSVNRLFRTARRLAIVVLPLFVVFAFVSSSSYLTTNDERSLYSAIPVIPTHITESAVASRNFLSLAMEEASVYMDFGSWLYFDNSPRARDALRQLNTGLLDEFSERAGPALVVVNDHFLPYGNPYVGGLYSGSALRTQLADVQASRVFDAGEVQVYLTP